jgi:hypothetical protein
MPYHYSNKKNAMPENSAEAKRQEAIAIAVKEGKPMPKAKKATGRRELTEAQKKMLEKHKVHHTAKHMAMMRKLMREGSSFTAAHKKTQKEIGK